MMLRRKLKYPKQLFLIVSILMSVLYLVISQQSINKNVRSFIQTTQSVIPTKINNDSIMLMGNPKEFQAIPDFPGNGGELGQLKRRLPVCLIIGSKKSGTGPLRVFLDLHPQITAAHKEIHFFDKDNNYEKGFEFYRYKMPKSYPWQITIEKSPKYFISERATKRIHDFNSSIKLILILRHPVKRMISDFWHEWRIAEKNGKSRSLKFEELAFENPTGEVKLDYEAVNVSLYYIHIKRYLEYFPRRQLHIVDGENFILNPVDEISKIETFLGLEHFVTKDKVYFDEKKGFFCYRKDDVKQCLGRSKGHDHPQVAEKYIAKLEEFFEPFNRKVFELLGQKFNWQ